MARVRHWLALSTALLAFVSGLEQVAAATTEDCDNDGKIILTKGSEEDEAIVYGTACNSTTLTVDSKNKLTASGLKIQEVKSIPDNVVELNLALNSISAIPEFSDATSLTKLTLTSNLFTSFSNLVVPSTLKTLDLSWNQIDSFTGMSLPSTLTELYVGGNKFTSLSGATFPSTLKLLYVHNLPLTTLSDAKLPDSIAYFIAVGNQMTELTKTVFPRTITSLNFSGNAITKVVGVTFPWSLSSLDLGSTEITEFEVSRSDYTTISRLKTFNANIKSASSCSTSGADQSTLAGSAVCVLTDDAFNKLYGSGSSSASSAGSSASTNDSSTSDDKSSDMSVILIVVICVAAVLAIALAVVGVRTYRMRMNKDTTLADTGFFANHTQMGSTGPSDGANSRIGGTNAMHPSNMTGTGYSFNTIFTGGKVTMMGGAAVESSFVKYRIPSNDIKIGKVIAKGGFGIVYVANYNGDQVVLKKILPEKASDDRCLAAFLDEIKLCSTLTHDKIIRFIGVSWNTLSDMGVVLEYMPNGDLEQLLRRQAGRKTTHPDEIFDWYQNSASLPSKAALALDIMEAIVYLHSFPSPIIHRDLKAKNVLLSKTYEAKLSDFGISREWQVDTTMTAGIGTMAWIAPEVLRGERYTEKADIYSLGVVLSELATCNKPFEGVTNALIVLKVTSEEKPDLGSDCPEDIRELALRCLSYNPSDRPSAMVAHYEMRTLLKLHTAFEL
ncbi:Tkl protein kinase, partial [Globisporangium splendens]